jgi:ATP-dependent DNA ligase
MQLPEIAPMDLEQIRAPFDDDEWLFEIKHDGFRALAYIDNGHRAGFRISECSP